jgi:hypothetical protein
MPPRRRRGARGGKQKGRLQSAGSKPLAGLILTAALRYDVLEDGGEGESREKKSDWRGRGVNKGELVDLNINGKSQYCLALHEISLAKRWITSIKKPIFIGLCNVNRG